LEELINEIVQAMGPYMDAGQMDRLKETLYIKLHDKKIVQESREVAVNSIDDNEKKIRMFIGSKQTTGRKPGTLKQYSDEIHKMLEFVKKRIEDINTMDLRYYYAVCRKRGISLCTMQTRIHYLSSFWDFLISEDLVQTNPVKKIGNIMVEKTLKQPYSAEEMEKLRNGCKTIRDRAIIEFLYSTGVRVSELCRLNRDEIDINSSQLKVFGKGSKERIVYLTDGARYYLRKYLMQRNDMEPALFASLIAPHERLTVSGIQFMLRELGEKVGVEKVHPHRFRRTIATDLLSRGMRIEEVKELLGHEKIDTTLIYCDIKQMNVKTSFMKFA